MKPTITRTFYLSTAFLLTLLSSPSIAQPDSLIRKYYKYGQLQLERMFDSTCTCYKIKEYYENGNIRSTKVQPTGESIFYFADGTIQCYSKAINDTPNGRSYCNFPGGTLSYENFFANGFKTGTWKYYHPDGTLKEKLKYQQNKTPWNSNDDYAKDMFYFNNKLAYTVELVAGRKTNLKVAHKERYDKLIASEPTLGKKSFIENCSPCHSANADIVGPKLNGVTEKRTNEWLTRMITNGDAFIKSGDKDAVELYKKWNNIQHPNFERLSSEEVAAIIDYLKTMK